MAIRFKIRSGTKAENTAYNGLKGELTMIDNSNLQTVMVHDGSGTGHELARRDLANVALPLGGVTFEYYLHKPSGSENVTGDPGVQHVGFSINPVSYTHLTLPTSDLV